jgi:hypothetical protein
MVHIEIVGILTAFGTCLVHGATEIKAIEFIMTRFYSVNLVTSLGYTRIMDAHTRSYAALNALLTLKAFGAYNAAVALYGTPTHLMRCLLLGDQVGFRRGTMWVWEPGVWEAKWVSGAWVITN